MWAVIPGSFFLPFSHASGRVSGLGFLHQDAELLRVWQAAVPCSWVMGSLVGSPTLEVGPKGLQA